MTSTNGTTATLGRFAKFDAAEQEGDPVGFAIGDDTFQCVPTAPAGALAHILRVAGTTIPLDESFALIEELLDDAEVEHFRLVAHRKNPVVKGTVIGAIVNHLIGAYTGRPTLPSSS